jgi:hypothetical protein
MIPGDGVVTLCWSNEFSRLNDKDLSYEVYVRSPHPGEVLQMSTLPPLPSMDHFAPATRLAGKSNSGSGARPSACGNPEGCSVQ